MNDLALIITSVLTLFFAAAVVFSRSAIYSAFGLILSFFGLAIMYLLWGSPFIAMIQVLIYTGAIVVLFVFVVMLLNLQQSSLNLSFNLFTVMMIVAASWFVALLFLRIFNVGALQSAVPIATTPPTINSNDMKTLSMMLFKQYLWPFEVLSLFLLALIVAVFALARPESQEDT